MPSRLIKPRAESKLKSDSPRTSRDSQRETTNGFLGAFSPSAVAADQAPAAGNAPPKTSTPGKGRLNSFLHGRKHSRSTLSPAPQPDSASTNVTSTPVSTPSATSKTATATATSKPQHSTPTTTPAPAPSPSTLILTPNRMSSIRAVGTSFEDEHHRDGTTEEESSSSSSIESQSVSASRSSAFSSSVNSNASGVSAMSQQQQQQQHKNGGSGGATDQSATVRLKSGFLDDVNLSNPTTQDATTTTTTSSLLSLPTLGPMVLQRRSGDMMRSSFSLERSSSFDIPARESSRTAVTTLSSLANGRSNLTESSSTDNNAVSDTSTITVTATTTTNGVWDSTIGKAGLGKTGRVINKLVSENETLKREVKILELRADEARGQSRLLEDKMERRDAEHEARALELTVTKTLLARKERQVETLQAAVEAETAKARGALEREAVWKEEMERASSEAKVKVEEATGHAALMEGRYNAIASHWGKQGEEVRKVVSETKAEVEKLSQERRVDDERIATLREVCDQQDGNIRELTRQKEEIAGQFERYKAEQELALRGIKQEAERREVEQEAVLEESREVLGKLKWALRVKENVMWAE